MFIISLHYKKPLEIVDQYLAQHAEFLDDCYRNNFFIVSGRKNPRTGGIIISQLKEKKQLEEIIKRDPFHIHGIADYEIVEFFPAKYHAKFAEFIV